MKPIAPFSRIFCTGHCRLLKADKPSAPSPRERERQTDRQTESLILGKRTRRRRRCHSFGDLRRV